MDMSRAIISFPIFGEKFKLNPSADFTLFNRTYYWYGLIIAFGALLALIYMMKASKRFGFKKENAIDFLLAALIPGIIGARLYYCVFYRNEAGVNPYFQDPASILYIWKGGLAIYGGIIFGVLGLVLYSKKKKYSVPAVLDLSALGVLIGQCVGRWGNFINREAYGVTTDSFGNYIDTTVPWKMGLTVDGATYYVHPTFLYESLWNLVGFVLLHLISKKRRYDGQVFILYIGWYGLGRMLIEGLRSDSLMLGSMRVSKLLATILLVAAVIILLYNWIFKKHDRSELYVNRAACASGSGAEEALSDDGKESSEEADNGGSESEKPEEEPEKADPEKEKEE
ncbi:MAG: prolipoprotein diacylglyceryl transferase [Oscillospiraceae bacterium]|nr:prolipoprotein diacylglyceryl transferase [Oscillospiraceae bacterium]